MAEKKPVPAKIEPTKEVLTDVQKAEQLLVKEEQKKKDECAKEINAVLTKYGYGLDTTPASVILVKQPAK